MPRRLVVPMENQKAFAFLDKATDAPMTLSQLVDAFEEMCRIPVEGEDTLLFETVTDNFTGIALFFFTLIRQYPNPAGGFFHLHMDVIYEPNEANQHFSCSVSQKETEEGFFDFVRRSPAYLSAQNERIIKVSVYLDEV